ALFARPGFVDRQRPAAMLRAVQRRNRGFRLLIISHFHKPEPLAAAGIAIRDHFRAVDRPVLREQSLQLGAVDIVRKVPDIKTLGHRRLSPKCDGPYDPYLWASRVMF